MLKLAHSHQPTMNQIDFDRAIEDGNESDLAGFYWVRHRSELHVAEWSNCFTAGHRKWEWCFTRAEVATRVDEIIEFIEPPTPI